MVKPFPREQWKELFFGEITEKKYAISNYGRFVSYTSDIESGTVLKCCDVKGYKLFRINRSKEGKKYTKNFYIHKLVAEHFLSTKRSDQEFVIHLDYVKDNNKAQNLRWASKQELEEHQNKNPKVVEDRKRLQRHNEMNEYKLNEAKVKIIKRKLADPNRKTRLKMIARQFGVSEMQLHRIRTGENWGHVEV